MNTPEKIENHAKSSRASLETLRPARSAPAVVRMRLFVAGNESNSVIARKNIQDIGRENLKGNFTLEIIDVFENVNAAFDENIIVAPALIIDEPVKMKIYGNLQDRLKVLTALGMK